MTSLAIPFAEQIDPAADPLPVSHKGTYIVVLRLSKSTDITVGKLGTYRFRRGYYLYVGSAFGPGGLRARLRHHIAVSARPRWHLDYLRPHTAVTAILVSRESQRLEHLWAGLLSRSCGLSIPVPFFGSSDCACRSHLFHSQTQPF